MSKFNFSSKLKNSKVKATRARYCHDWANEWEKKHVDLVEKLKDELDNLDMQDQVRDRIIELLGDLGGLHRPKFVALHGVVDELIYPSSPLKEDGQA